MRSTQSARRVALPALAAALVAAGCRPDRRPVYQQPNLTAGPLVTLKGDGYWYIDEIDGFRVEHSEAHVLVFNRGNQVSAKPGVHRVRAVYSDVNNQRGSATFTSNFGAGHTYAFIPVDAFNRALKVVDDTAPASPPLHNLEDDNGPVAK